MTITEKGGILGAEKRKSVRPRLSVGLDYERGDARQKGDIE